MAEKKEIKKYINQSNTVSTSLTRISSATSYKIIKYGMHKLELLFGTGNSKKTLSEYKKMNLLQADNWKNIAWEDFTCSYSITEFCENLNIQDGGKQREEIRKMMDNVVGEKIYLKLEDREKWFPWFVEAEYIYSDEDTNEQKITLRFNPGVIGTALIQNENYSHIELLVIGKIKSYYGLRIYELIKAFYNKKGRYGNEKGEWKTDWYSIDFLKKFLQCETSYIGRLNNFIQKAIKNPVDEINTVCESLEINLHVDIDFKRGGRGGKQIQSIRFICAEKGNTLRITKYDSKELIAEKEAHNQTIFESETLKDKYIKNGMWDEICNEFWNIEKGKSLYCQSPEYRNSIIFEVAVLNYINENYEKTEE